MIWRRIPLGDKVLAGAALVMVGIEADFVVRFGPLPEYLAYIAIHLVFVPVLLVRRVWVKASFLASYGLLAGLALVVQLSRVNLGVTPLLIAAPLSLWSITRSGPDRRWGIAALFLAVLGSFVSPVRHLAVPGLSVAVQVVVVVSCYLVASHLRRQEEQHLKELDARARQYDAQVAEAISAERLMVAREVHDVVAHNLAVVRVQSSTALAIDTPEQLRSAMQVIEESSNAALREVRSVVAALRDDGAGVPSTDLTRVPEMVQASIAAGARLTSSVPDEETLRSWRDSWPAPVSLTVVRVLQEGLTNMLKHGGKQPEGRLCLESVDARCHIVIDNTVGEVDSRSGFGLVGLRERVAICGGELEAGRQGDRFVLEVWLPVG